jgi:putative phage-type endonuclease
LIREYYESTVGHMHLEEYEEELVAQVVELAHAQDMQVTPDEVENALDVFRFYAPCRTSISCRSAANAAESVARLDALPKHAQRTAEWHDVRRNMITASSVYKVFGSQAKQNELVVEKSAPAVERAEGGDGPRQWGVKFERISANYYEHTYRTQLREYGCLAHPVHSFLGASPDGVNVSEGPLFGRMLEIKNPVSREITATPPEEYWIQIQIQMEVCGLESCDLLQTKFVEYASHRDFEADGTYQTSADGSPKGTILHYMVDGRVHYEYPPYQATQEEAAAFEAALPEMEWVVTTYWKLAQVECTLIERNRAWFAEALPQIAALWRVIESARVTGVEPYLPKKRRKLRNDVNEAVGVFLEFSVGDHDLVVEQEPLV